MEATQASPHDISAPLPQSAIRQILTDYAVLTKPKVQTLLLFTTVTTMYVAGSPSLSLVLLTCLGGYLSAGAAGAINHYWDRDIDAKMPRTALRPVASGRISPRAALVEYAFAHASMHCSTSPASHAAAASCTSAGVMVSGYTRPPVFGPQLLQPSAAARPPTAHHRCMPLQ